MDKCLVDLIRNAVNLVDPFVAVFTDSGFRKYFLTAKYTFYFVYTFKIRFNQRVQEELCAMRTSVSIWFDDFKAIGTFLHVRSFVPV